MFMFSPSDHKPATVSLDDHADSEQARGDVLAVRSFGSSASVTGSMLGGV